MDFSRRHTWRNLRRHNWRNFRRRLRNRRRRKYRRCGPTTRQFCRCGRVMRNHCPTGKCKRCKRRVLDGGRGRWFERRAKRNRFKNVVGPTRHFRGNSKFENAHDRRVDDVDDTTSPWACSLYKSPWFACVPRKGDLTKIQNYKTKGIFGRRTWECSVDNSMWYPCKANSRDLIVGRGSNYFAHYPARLAFGKATKKWLNKRGLKHVVFRPKFHAKKKIGSKFHRLKFRL